MPELTCAFMRSAPHQTYPQRELPQNFFGNSGGPRPRESLMRCAIPKNGYFFGSDQIPDDFANSLEDLILLHRVNQSRARRMEALQKKMLTLQLSRRESCWARRRSASKDMRRTPDAEPSWRLIPRR